MASDHQRQLIRQYADGPEVLRAALRAIPDQAMKWRPAPTKWSVHEIVCHCADAEVNGSARIRYLVAETTPRVIGYDQDGWAKTFDYHQMSVDQALDVVEAVRKWTAPLLERLPEQAFWREGTHTEIGRYTGEKWLEVYADHLHAHARQIERNLSAWRARPSGGVAKGSIVA